MAKDFEITPLRLTRKQRLKKEWMKMWERIGSRILSLPPFLQNIVLDDINTAIENRVAIMEMIENAKKRDQNR